VLLLLVLAAVVADAAGCLEGRPLMQLSKCCGFTIQFSGGLVKNQRIACCFYHAGTEIQD